MIGNRLRSGFHFFGIRQIVALLYFQFGIKLIDQGDSRRNVQPHDLVVRDVIQILHDGAQTVSVGCYHHLASSHQAGNDHFIPKGHGAGYRVFQGFTERDLRFFEVSITRVFAGIAFVVLTQGGRWHIIASAPDQHLFIAVFLGSFGLVQALQRAIMPFVQPPVVMNRSMHQIHLIQSEPEGADGTFEGGGVGFVKAEACRFQSASGLAGLHNPLFGKINVGPAGKEVCFVPQAFAVAYQYYFVHI